MLAAELLSANIHVATHIRLSLTRVTVFTVLSDRNIELAIMKTKQKEITRKQTPLGFERNPFSMILIEVKTELEDLGFALR